MKSEHRGLGLVGVVCLLATACNGQTSVNGDVPVCPGERTVWVDGGPGCRVRCPDGVACSNETVTGLMFWRNDSVPSEPYAPVLPVALGGREEIGIDDVSPSTFVPRADQTVLGMFDENDVQRTAVVTGITAGHGIYRVVDEHGAVEDELPVDVAPVDHMAFLAASRPANRIVQDPLDVVLVGSSFLEAGIHLYDTTGRELIDIALTLQTMDAAQTQLTADHQAVTIPALNTVGTLPYVVHTGQATFTGSIRIVPAADGMGVGRIFTNSEAAAHSIDDTLPRSETTFCAQPTYQGAPMQGGWCSATVAPTRPLGGPIGCCVTLTPDATTTAYTVTMTLGSVTQSFTLHYAAP